MGTHMKTTIEISPPLLNQARKLAARQGTTLRALVEEGLRKVVAENRRPEGFQDRGRPTRGQSLVAPGVVPDLLFRGPILGLRHPRLPRFDALVFNIPKGVGQIVEFVGARHELHGQRRML